MEIAITVQLDMVYQTIFEKWQKYKLHLCRFTNKTIITRSLMGINMIRFEFFNDTMILCKNKLFWRIWSQNANSVFPKDTAVECHCMHLFIVCSWQGPCICKGKCVCIIMTNCKKMYLFGQWWLCGKLYSFLRWLGGTLMSILRFLHLTSHALAAQRPYPFILHSIS